MSPTGDLLVTTIFLGREFPLSLLRVSQVLHWHGTKPVAARPLGQHIILLRCDRSACLACKCSTCSSPGECHGSLSAKWRVAGCSAGDCSKRCTPCGWLVLTKTAPCRVTIAKAMMTWQIMTRGLAQAGNKTSKTALCSQWCKPEWSADASGPGNQCDCQLFSFGM